MLEAMEVAEVPARPAAVIPLVVPRAEMQAVMGPAIGELLAAVAAMGLVPAGPVFAHHRRAPGATFDFELGVPVDGAVVASGRVRPGELPAATVARATHRGPYEGLPASWGEFQAWMAARGLEPAPDLWEVYATGPHSDPDPAGWRTELFRPLVDRG